MKLLKTNNLSLTQQITLAALFTALATVCQKVFAVNYIPVVPFLRISFCGPALIIFSSIFLGPIFGLFVGAASDLLGYLIFDPKTMGFFPQITVIYATLGFVSYFIYRLFVRKNIGKIVIIFKYALILFLIGGLAAYLFTRDALTLYGKTYDLSLTTKIIAIASTIVLTIISELFILVIKRSGRLKELDINIDSLNIALIVIEILIMVVLGTLMKGFAFGFETYVAILICQLLVMFINIPLNLFFISLFLKITRKYY